MSNPTNRRRFLAGTAGALGTLLLSGCDRLADSDWVRTLLASAEGVNRRLHRWLVSPKDADLAKAYAEFIACDREFHFDPAGAEQEEEEREAFYQNWCDLMDRVLYADVNSPNSLIIVSLMGIRVSDLLTDSLDILESWDGYSKPRDLEDDRIATAFWRIAEYGRRLGGHVEPVGGAA